MQTFFISIISFRWLPSGGNLRALHPVSGGSRHQPLQTRLFKLEQMSYDFLLTNGSVLFTMCTIDLEVI